MHAAPEGYYSPAQRTEQIAQARAANAQTTLAKDPRLHAINNQIASFTERVFAHVRGLNEKADCIVGGAPVGKGTESDPPTPVPNGVLDQIEMSLRALSDKIDDLADAERRFAGLA